jgi:DNA-binding response OmpR family regulator
MRILLIEDSIDLGKEVCAFLITEREIVDWSKNIKDASEFISINEYDFILLDLGLPDGDGLSLISEIQEIQPSVSLIIITARNQVEDKILGLQKGADDYLSKPFSLLELKARMQAISRRKGGWNSNTIILGEFTIDLNQKSVFHLQKEITLTSKEFMLLHFFIINKNRVLTRFQLSEHLWGEPIDDDHQSNYIDVHIKNIRKKLGAFADISFLETVRGLGYILKVK